MTAVAQRQEAPIARSKVFELERHILAMPQVEIPIVHHFSPGVYAREAHIPKGLIVTGAIHKFPTLNILSKGDISVLIDGNVKRIQAPYTVVSPAGTKRIAITHEDCVWTTIFGTEMTVPEDIVNHFTTNDEQEYLTNCERKLI